MQPKTLAFYLPQFHRVKENDEWWGEGFTEWTAVRGAEPLFEGHNQPRVPLNNNYYNLLEHSTMAWQADLMKKYRVDGMCIYHYWFENGRRILEKPAENLLKWKDIDMPFCFDWANVSWVKTWKKIKEDTLVWSSVYEKQDSRNKKGVLIQQCYGREREWEEHFKYLSDFFADGRYIKLDNKPVFIIDSPYEICCLGEMAGYFNIRAKEIGFDGIYFIGARKCSFGGLDASFAIQPAFSETSYDRMWENALNQKFAKGKVGYFCTGVDCDNSPRMGKESFIMHGSSPQKFYEYYKKLYRKSQIMGNEFIFVNAWNEWGEGMYLEPDEKYGFGYLEALSQAVDECADKEICDEEKTAIADCFYEESAAETQVQNLLRYNALLNDWICLKEKNIGLSKFFEKYRYQDIAIYGMGKLGIHLFNELDHGDTCVGYGIDQNARSIDENIGIEIYSPDQQLPEIDAVVITITTQYDEISRMLRKNASMKCPMVTIEEIIHELLQEQ